MVVSRGEVEGCRSIALLACVHVSARLAEQRHHLRVPQLRSHVQRRLPRHVVGVVDVHPVLDQRGDHRRLAAPGRSYEG